MLTVAKIHSEAKQARGRSSAGYLHYLGAAAAREKGFEAYARGAGEGPAPFWLGGAPAALGLGQDAELEHVERMARGQHPLTGEPLLRGAGRHHVTGVDMTFSAPKDFSIVYAAADDAMRKELLGALRGATAAAMSHAEATAVTRHRAGGAEKRRARAIAAAAHIHFASRALDPQLHVHVLALNLGQREDGSWSSLEQRGVFERKLSIGALWRTELARRVADLGFEVEPDGPYFKIRGVEDWQREAASTRTREIDELLRERGEAGPAARRAASLASRKAKAEPPLPELLAGFRKLACELGLSPESVAAMRAGPRPMEPLAIDREALVAELMESKSCATGSGLLAAVCEKGMGRWSAEQCLAEAAEIMRSEGVVRLGASELLDEVFSSKATRDMERAISERVEAGRLDASLAIPRALVDAEFDALEEELSATIGAPCSLSQQREATAAIACEPGSCQLVEGWAGSGKTTMLRAAARAWSAAGVSVVGCCQSASAAQSLSREAGIPSRTIASLLLALQSGKATLSARTVVVLDEAGLVGSREFGLLQDAAIAAGAKMVCVGDAKQLQPVAAGGIFGALCRLHGRAEVSQIQRQRTDAGPMLDWLDERARRGLFEPERAAALRALPPDAQAAAIEAACAADIKLGRAFGRWRDRYDHKWMRSVVERFAKGEAGEALRAMDERGRVQLAPDREAALGGLISAWAEDRAGVADKLIVAATRADVAELNARARARLAADGAIEDARGAEFDIKRRDGSQASIRMAPGDRVAFTKNDRSLGVSNGSSGTLADIERREFGLVLRVALDEPNHRGESEVRVPASFGCFDLGYATTGQKAQGRTVDSCHVLAGRGDRHWIYVAASRSRFATTLHVDAEALEPLDPESHQAERPGLGRDEALDALAASMSRDRPKATTLDFDAAEISRPRPVELAAAPAATSDISRGAAPCERAALGTAKTAADLLADAARKLGRAFAAYRSRGRLAADEPIQRPR